MSLFSPPVLCCAIARHQPAVERSNKDGLRTGPGQIDKEGMKKVFSRLNPNGLGFVGSFLQFVRAETTLTTQGIPTLQRS